MAVRLSPRLIRALIRIAVKPFLGPPFPFWFQRFWLRAVSAVNRPCAQASRANIDVAGLSSLMARPEGSDPERTILYLHGGGYCVGSWSTHLGPATHLAVAARATVVAPNYRLAPEHPHPAALKDALKVYRWILDRGVPPTRVTLAGDSAGGGLALALAIGIRDSKLPNPASLVLLSPWTDLTGASDSMRRNVRIDPMLRPRWPRQCATHYLGGRDPKTPACSPLFADHRGLPPTLIQVGSDELIVDDSTRLAERCRSAGVDVTLHQYDGLWHDFQSHAGMLDAADQAMGEIAEFIASHEKASDSGKNAV
ncbi:MAG: alpha/beta hydrolase [Myxococcales bacterium]